MSLTNALPADALACACAALRWPTDAIANLLADPDGHDLPFERAYDIAWNVRHLTASARDRETALALFAEFGLPATPDPTARTLARESLEILDSRERARELLSRGVALARELLAQGWTEGSIARELATEYHLPAAEAARAAAIAATDPVRPSPTSRG